MKRALDLPIRRKMMVENEKAAQSIQEMNLTSAREVKYNLKRQVVS